jgi:D-alanyl-lipoteichoic acid acyltransferase DltB (MBOAT superfamily)
MVFSSVPFLFYFLPIFLVAYAATPTIRGKNLTTLLFSLVFYAWGEPRFVIVLLASIAANWAAALAIDGASGTTRRILLALAVSANLLLLIVFKYAGFLSGIVAEFLHPLGLGIKVVSLPLPLGISFFTFHCLSYLIDVYRRRFVANRDPVEVALYIALFPQLIAGPIVRYKTVARQLRVRRHTLARASAGARIFIIGLAQKVLIADQIATLADTVFDHTTVPTLAEAWTGLLAYTIQIYFDFAGYSSMAVGLGLCLGFSLPRNFRLPYSSGSVTAFWRRWHMSLSSWLRDYLYIPLGGSRGPAWQTWRNLFSVFLLCGLWHGASWNFVAWGAWHGGFLAAERAGLGRFLARLHGVVGWVYAMGVVMGGWVLFRAHDLSHAGTFWGGLIGLHGSRMGFDTHAALRPVVMVALLAGVVLSVAPRWIPVPRLPQPMYAICDTAWTFALLASAMSWVAAGGYSPFLYFRF